MLKIYSNVIELIFADYKLDDETPIALRNVIEVFLRLRDADFIHPQHKPWFYFMLTSHLLTSIEDFNKYMKDQYGITSSVTSIRSPWKKVDDSELKPLYRALIKLKNKIIEVLELKKSENPSLNLINYANAYAQELDFANYLPSNHDRAIDLFQIVGKHLQVAFAYLFKQRKSSSALIETEILAVQHYMIAMLTELTPDSVNWQSAVIRKLTENTREHTLQQHGQGSFAARMLQACIFRSRYATVARKGTKIASAEKFVSQLRDETIELYLQQYPQNLFLEEILYHPEQLTIARFTRLRMEHSNDPQALVGSMLHFVKQLVIEPLDRSRREEADIFWFFERHLGVSYANIEWLNSNINPNDVTNIMLLAKSILEFNGILYLLNKQDRCMYQAYVTDWHTTNVLGSHLDEDSPKRHLYHAIGITEDQDIIAIESITQTKHKFLAIQQHIERTCYFSGAYQKLNQYVYWLKTKGRGETTQLLKETFQREFATKFASLQMFFKILLIQFEQFNVELPVHLRRALQDFINNFPADKDCRSNLVKLIDELIEFVMIIIQHREIQHNFPQTYYVGNIDNSLPYANRFERFPSAATNLSGPHIRGDVFWLINRTTDGTYLSYRPTDYAALAKLCYLIYQDLQTRDRSSLLNIIILAIGAQDEAGKDLNQYPVGEHLFTVNSTKYKLISSDKNGERIYELSQVKKLGTKILCTFVVCNLQTPDNSASVVDTETEEKLIYIYQQPYKIMHCHSTVGRSLTHQLAASGVRLINELLAIDDLPLFLEKLSDDGNEIYTSEIERIQVLMSFFNFVYDSTNTESRLRCAEIAVHLSGFLESLRILFSGDPNFSDYHIRKIGGIFIDLLTGLRQMQYAVQESDQLLSAIGLVCSHYARTALRADDKAIEFFKRSLIASNAISTFAEGFDLNESRFEPTVRISRTTELKEPRAKSLLPEPTPTAPPSVPKVVSKKIIPKTATIVSAAGMPQFFPKKIVPKAPTILSKTNYVPLPIFSDRSVDVSHDHIEPIIQPSLNLDPKSHYITLPPSDPFRNPDPIPTGNNLPTHSTNPHLTFPPNKIVPAPEDESLNATVIPKTVPKGL